MPYGCCCVRIQLSRLLVRDAAGFWRPAHQSITQDRLSVRCNNATHFGVIQASAFGPQLTASTRPGASARAMYKSTAVNVRGVARFTRPAPRSGMMRLGRTWLHQTRAIHLDVPNAPANAAPWRKTLSHERHCRRCRSFRDGRGSRCYSDASPSIRIGTGRTPRLPHNRRTGTGAGARRRCHHVPIWTSAAAKNSGYGTAAPVVPVRSSLIVGALKKIEDRLRRHVLLERCWFLRPVRLPADPEHSTGAVSSR